jgi:hypothetical protein
VRARCANQGPLQSHDGMGSLVENLTLTSHRLEDTLMRKASEVDAQRQLAPSRICPIQFTSSYQIVVHGNQLEKLGDLPMRLATTLAGTREEIISSQIGLNLELELFLFLFGHSR